MGHHFGEGARGIGADDGHVVFAGELQQRAVVGGVVGPRAGLALEGGVGQLAGGVLGHQRLHVPLKHLHSDNQLAGLFQLQQVFGHLQLQPVRQGVVVLLAEEHHVGLGQLGQHLVVVGGLASGGEEAVGRPVAAQGEAGEAGEQQKETGETKEAHRIGSWPNANKERHAERSRGISRAVVYQSNGITTTREMLRLRSSMTYFYS